MSTPGDPAAEGVGDKVGPARIPSQQAADPQPRVDHHGGRHSGPIPSAQWSPPRDIHTESHWTPAPMSAAPAGPTASPLPSHPAKPLHAPPVGYHSSSGPQPPFTGSPYWPNRATPSYLGHPGPSQRQWSHDGSRSVRRWWRITIAMATIAIGLLVTVIVYEPHRTGTKTVSPSALSDVLLSSQEAANLVGAQTLSGEPVQDKLAATAIVDEDCAGVVGAAEQKAYEQSSWTGVRSQALSDATAKGWRLTQAVVSFSDAQGARAFVTDAAASWKKCANREINTRNVKKDDPRNLFWTTGPASQADGILAMTMIQESQGWNCQRALSARNNVVIDLELCGRNVPGSVVPQFVTAVDNKVDAQS